MAEDRHRKGGTAVLSGDWDPSWAARVSVAATWGATCLIVLSVSWGAGVGCKRQEPTNKPEHAVERWIAAMQHLRSEPKSERAAFELLSASARRNLADRASRASAATGQQLTPESMLVPATFRLRFPIRSMTSRVAGDRAIVEVTGAHQRAEVPCVREKGTWHVDLMIPALPAVEKRPDAGI